MDDFQVKNQGWVSYQLFRQARRLGIDHVRVTIPFAILGVVVGLLLLGFASFTTYLSVKYGWTSHNVFFVIVMYFFALLFFSMPIIYTKAGAHFLARQQTPNFFGADAHAHTQAQEDGQIRGRGHHTEVIYTVSLDSQGIKVTYLSNHVHYSWNELLSLERIPGALVLIANRSSRETIITGQGLSPALGYVHPLVVLPSANYVQGSEAQVIAYAHAHLGVASAIPKPAQPDRQQLTDPALLSKLQQLFQKWGAPTATHVRFQTSVPPAGVKLFTSTFDTFGEDEGFGEDTPLLDYLRDCTARLDDADLMPVCVQNVIQDINQLSPGYLGSGKPLYVFMTRHAPDWDTPVFSLIINWPTK
jgi:hypothetical protein